jgi:hypothetical protein
MSYNPNPQDQGWVTCRERLLETIAKWQGRRRPLGVVIDCPADSGGSSDLMAEINAAYEAVRHGR